MKKILNWKIFLTLLILSLLSIFAIFPYVITLQGDLLKQSGISIPLLFVVQLLQCSILFSITIFVGLILARKIDFQLPLLEALAANKEYKKIIKQISVKSAVAGVIVAIAIYAIDYLFALGGASISTSQNLAPIWQKLLAAFYGGIAEEMLMRLFVMTLFIWLGMKIAKQTKASQSVILISIVLASIIFGLGHLPITSSLTKITPVIILRAIVLNGIGGIVFGWLYWKKGLESAIIAHFTADIFLLTILPLIFN